MLVFSLEFQYTKLTRKDLERLTRTNFRSNFGLVENMQAWVSKVRNNDLSVDMMLIN